MEEPTEQTSHDGVAQDRPRRVPRTMVGGFAVLGGTVGLFTGMSESPVAATVLSALFSLIGAAGLFAMLRRFDQTEAAVQRMRSVGISIISFCVCAVALLFVGIELREGRLGTSAEPPKAQARDFDVTTLGTEVPASDLAKLALLDLELSQLPITPQSRHAVLRRLATMNASTQPAWTQKRVDALRKQAERTSKAISGVIHDMDSTQSEIQGVKKELSAAAKNNAHLEKAIDALSDLDSGLDGSHDLFIETTDMIDEFAARITPTSNADHLSEVLELVSSFRASLQNNKGVEVPETPTEDVPRLRRRSIKP